MFVYMKEQNCGQKIRGIDEFFEKFSGANQCKMLVVYTGKKQKLN